MRTHVVAVCLLVSACLQAAEPAPDPVKEHREKMQGVWTAIELDGAGQHVPKDAKEFRLLFKEDTVIFERGGEKKEYRFRLQRAPGSGLSGQQGEIDLIPVRGKHEGLTWRGIYFLSAAHFKLCFHKRDPGKRPSEFSAKIDVGFWRIDCRRFDPDARSRVGRSQHAPTIQFNGPVQIRFTSAVADTDHGKVAAPTAAPGSKEALLEQLDKSFLDKGYSLPGWRRQTKQVFLSAIMGTPGLGEGTWTKYKAREILGGRHERIVVEAAFPNQDAKAKPIVVTGFLQPDG